MSARYVCSFENDAGEDHVITIDLTEREVEAARAHECPDIAAMGYALRAAYRVAPEGFRHRAGGVSCVN
jgi:hypothetical protein